MKKKTMLKDNQIDLKHGFVLELVKHPIGDMNGNLEGFLTYIGKEVEIEPKNKRFYSDQVEAIKDFDNRIIPEFISGNSGWLLHKEESTDSCKEQMEKRKEILDSKIKDFELAWKEKNEFYSYPYVYGLIPMFGNYQFSFTDCSLSFLEDFVSFLNEDKSRLNNLEDSKYDFLEKIIDDFKKSLP